MLVCGGNQSAMGGVISALPWFIRTAKCEFKREEVKVQPCQFEGRERESGIVDRKVGGVAGKKPVGCFAFVAITIIR
jgi:hypothetical protein